jgi:acyl-coenzyme A thioesterase PaaI-like protein
MFSMDLPARLQAARESRWQRVLLNMLLPWMVPFNQPHGFRARPLSGGGVAVHIPFWRVNRNHIRGLHACAMATAAEFCCGLALLEKVDLRKHRMIMANLQMDYHYQGKTSAVARCVPDAGEIQRKLGILDTEGSVTLTLEVPIADVDGKHLATGRITWQLKPWSRVRTPT